jgi:predicted dehydrogenase
MIRAAIVGCGKIADAHASQILSTGVGNLVGVCDREPLMANQLCERFEVQAAFGDLTELLRRLHPDVVHITTPPPSHYELARECLESGCHVFVEKPFTLRAAEAASLVALAQRKGLKLTVGHDCQFTYVARRLRALVSEGYLGGVPVHMESIFCYDLSDPRYARALLADRQHWVRRLPGRLLQNIISHGIARIAEFLPSDGIDVKAYGFISEQLRNMGELEIVDELRVVVSDRRRTTAFFTFSSQMRPSLHQFRIYGPRNGLILDQDHDTLIRLRGHRLTSYAEKFVPPLLMAKEYGASLATTLRLFLRRDLHMKAGLRNLIESFYDCIATDQPPPIPYREILLTSSIMESIFEQLSPEAERRRVGGCERAMPEANELATVSPG